MTTQQSAPPVRQAPLADLFPPGGISDTVAGRLSATRAAASAAQPTGSGPARALFREDLAGLTELRRQLVALGFAGADLDRQLLAATLDQERDRATVRLATAQAYYRRFAGFTLELLYARLLADGFTPERARLYAELAFARGKAATLVEGEPDFDLPTPAETSAALAAIATRGAAP